MDKSSHRDGGAEGEEGWLSGTTVEESFVGPADTDIGDCREEVVVGRVARPDECL